MEFTFNGTTYSANGACTHCYSKEAGRAKVRITFDDFSAAHKLFADKKGNQEVETIFKPTNKPKQGYIYTESYDGEHYGFSLRRLLERLSYRANQETNNANYHLSNVIRIMKDGDIANAKSSIMQVYSSANRLEGIINSICEISAATIDYSAEKEFSKHLIDLHRKQLSEIVSSEIISGLEEAQSEER